MHLSTVLVGDTCHNRRDRQPTGDKEAERRQQHPQEQQARSVRPAEGVGRRHGTAAGVNSGWE